MHERVHRQHPRLLLTECSKVGESLQGLGDEGERTLRFGIRRRGDEGEELGIQNGGHEEAQEDESRH